MPPKRRRTTVCVNCRDRRVSCDRQRPTCSRCKQYHVNCRYSESIIEFVTEPLQTANSSADLFPNTWTSVIDQQETFVKRSRTTSVPFWTLVENNDHDLEKRLGKFDNRITLDDTAVPLGAFGEGFLTRLITELPSADVCQSLVDNFTENIYPFVPICEPDLLQGLPSFSTDSPTECVILQLAVLYTGAVNSSSPFATRIRALYDEIFHTVDLASFHVTSCSIFLLQGFVIMNTLTSSQVVPSTAFGWLAQAIRFAQSLRLHADQGSSIMRIDAEIHRRLWWHLMFLDVEGTIATGLPGIMRSDGHTTLLPSFKNTPNRIVAYGHWHWHWAHRMQMWAERMPESEEIEDFREIIQRLIDMAEDDWSRLYLKMQVERAYCMLGLRFWQLDQFKGNECRSEVVVTAQSFLLNCVQLSSSSKFSWFVPGLTQPLYGLIILLMHLSKCTQNEDLSRDLVDQIFTIRRTWFTKGYLIPIARNLPGLKRPIETSSRYLTLTRLKKELWQKRGWQSQVNGINIMNSTNDDNSLGALLESTFAGDPMDLFTWNEWELYK